MNCQHPRWMKVGHLPPARFPLPRKMLPSHIRDEFDAGIMKFPEVEPVRLPARDVMKCVKCERTKTVDQT